jgi:hypothetical protein
MTPEVALAAIAAPVTLLAAVVGTGVLGATHADVGGRLAADVANEGHGFRGLDFVAHGFMGTLGRVFT